MSLDLPPDLCLLESQVAGHTIESTSQKYGMLRNLSGKLVFKPLSKPLYAEREIAFYKEIQEAQIFDKEIKQLIPQYEGQVELSIDGKKQLFIKMENITQSMAKPCVMDIKVGRRTWDPLATANKIAMEEQKYSACKQTIGLCIPGFQMYTINGDFLKYGKDYGKNLTHKTFFDTLVMFLTAQKTCYKPLIRTILNQLYSLHKWFTAQTSVNFYSSSILIAYDFDVLKRKLEGNMTSENVCSSSNGCNEREKCSEKKKDFNCSSWVKVKIIDFAHVFESETKTCDANYLFGLQNLIYMLQEILITY